MRNVIGSFKGSNGYMSNFSQHPVEAFFKTWPTSEHLYQAMKTDVEEESENIRKSLTPGRAKRLGQTCTKRSDWDEVKYGVMKSIVLLKFKQHTSIAKKLINTGDSLIKEGNTWCDNTWGDCQCDKCKDIEGTNWLGKILMEVREELKNGS